MWGKKIGGEKVFFEKMKYSRRVGVRKHHGSKTIKNEDSNGTLGAMHFLEAI